jgi:hypothetical protein
MLRLPGTSLVSKEKQFCSPATAHGLHGAWIYIYGMDVQAWHDLMSYAPMLLISHFDGHSFIHEYFRSTLLDDWPSVSAPNQLDLFYFS